MLAFALGFFFVHEVVEGQGGEVGHVLVHAGSLNHFVFLVLYKKRTILILDELLLNPQILRLTRFLVHSLILRRQTLLALNAPLLPH